MDSAEGYDVEYPADWYRGGTVSDPGRAQLLCRFFDPAPFNIPPNSDFFGSALEVSPLDQSFDDALASLIDRRFYRTVAREQLSLQGRHRAFRLELVATGQGLEDRGTQTYGYLVRRLDGPPVFVRTTARAGEPIVHRAVVDHAAQTLRLFAVPPDVPTLPEPVAEKREAILSALEQQDLRALGALVDPDEFTYTFGQPVAGGATEYFRAHPEAVENLRRVLELPYTLSGGIYVWPFAYDKDLGELTAYELGLLGTLLPPAGEGQTAYLGYRAGIRPDGRWVFFVAGD